MLRATALPREPIVIGHKPAALLLRAAIEASMEYERERLRQGLERTASLRDWGNDPQ